MEKIRFFSTAKIMLESKNWVTFNKHIDIANKLLMCLTFFNKEIWCKKKYPKDDSNPLQINFQNMHCLNISYASGYQINGILAHWKDILAKKNRMF